MGAGVVGLLTGLFARHLGAAEVAVVDVTPGAARAAAEALGLVPVDEAAVDPGRRWCKDRWVHGPATGAPTWCSSAGAAARALADGPARRCAPSGP